MNIIEIRKLKQQRDANALAEQLKRLSKEKPFVLRQAYGEGPGLLEELPFVVSLGALGGFIAGRLEDIDRRRAQSRILQLEEDMGEITEALEEIGQPAVEPLMRRLSK